MSSKLESNQSADAALAELTAAQRLVADPEVAIESVALHVRRAVELSTEDDSPAASAALHDAAIERYVEPDEREQQRDVVRWLAAPRPTDMDVPSRAAMRLHVEALRCLLGGDAVRDPAARLGILFLVLVVLSLMFAGTYGLFRSASGPWRVHWYPEPEFKGSPRTEQVRTVDFVWDGSPARGIPKDDWSARFETCLEIDEETNARFKLTSDDGSRLYIDGEKIIDNWGAHAVRSRTGRTTLQAGVHHVTLEFFEARFKATLELQAAFDDEDDLEPIPMSMVDAPSKKGDVPCQE
jgi:hypothetical protein